MRRDDVDPGGVGHAALRAQRLAERVLARVARDTVGEHVAQARAPKLLPAATRLAPVVRPPDPVAPAFATATMAHAAGATVTPSLASAPPERAERAAPPAPRAPAAPLDRE